LCFIFSGVTFDSGGVSIKPSANMGDMKADMTGGACVAQTVLALAKQRASTNVVAIVRMICWL
jgi:leucyl aminopeptidase